MKIKYLFLIVCSFAAGTLFAQSDNTEGPPKPQLPQVVPPSPTVAALMKFEEVPVDNYSGIPDISMPFFGAGLGSGVQLDVKLSYHPDNINANQAASDCGLGWSLMAGGTISRTVRGLPDEMPLTADASNNTKEGLYTATNPFYTFDSQYAAAALNLSGDFANTFLWDVNVRGKFDTEHDLYQYNFLGHSGRFIIKKVNGILQVLKLDVNILQITNFYNSTTNVPTSFEIIDEYGFKYVFNVIEVSSVSSLSTSQSPLSERMPVTTGDNLYSYNSAFHLSAIYDANSVMVAQFDYNPAARNETFITGSSTVTHEKNGTLSNYNDIFRTNPDYNPLAILQSNSTSNSTQTRKLSQISIPGKSKIIFNYSQGRQDSNLGLPQNSYKLNDVTVQDWYGNNVRKFTLGFGYEQQIDNRMFLLSLKEYGSDLSTFTTKNFTYYEPGNTGNLGKDYWGFLNDRPAFISPYLEQYRETTPQFCTAGVLTKITTPTGGATVLDFESNTYSYIGDQEITDFDSNPDNWTPQESLKVFTTRGSNTTSFFELYQAQDVYFKTSNDFMSSGINDWYFNIYKQNGTSDTLVGGINAASACTGDCYQKITLQPGTYRVNFVTPQQPVGGQPDTFFARITAYYKTKPLGATPQSPPPPVKKYLYGGGIRIKAISYFTTSDTENTLPAKKTNYNYSFFADPSQISGSLVYPKPTFHFEKSKKECVVERDNQGQGLAWHEFDMIYDSYTSTNNLAAVKTKGSDVGYKNVTVYETGNGKTEYEYTSALEYPEAMESSNVSYPYLPTLNIDYKRGLLLRQRVYTEGLLKLKETVNTYEFSEHAERTGIRIYNPQDYAFRNYHGKKTWPQYKDYITKCTQSSTFVNCLPHPNEPDDMNCNCFCYYDIPAVWTDFSVLNEGFGWAKLMTTNNSEYFYNSSGALTGTKSVLMTNSYGSNMKLSASEMTSSTGESLVSKYYYANDHELDNDPNIVTIRARSINWVPLMTESYRAGSLVARQKTLYKDFGSGQILPEQMQFGKETKTPETRIRYTKYDAKGNPLEVQQENGAKVCYLWGYDASVPVAKIENMEYANILPATLISDIVTASSATGSESQMLTKLAALRTAPALADALVTTFTYKPQVGPSTVTDPKGDKLTYSYDVFGRLVKVTDRNGKILSENEYHYKN